MSRDNGEFGRNGELEPIGVVDIGSNSVRLVVYEGAVRSPTPIFNEKVLCGLGRQVGSTGHLGEEAVERALEALGRFKAIARILGVKNVRAIATAACRDASDGPDFIARGEKALGTRIQVLSGQQEAELAANGIMMGFRSPDGIAGDLGGGSLELIEVEGDDAAPVRHAAARRLAADRRRRAAGSTRRIDIADEAIARVPWLDEGRGRAFYAVGGTWRAIARLHMEQTSYPLRVMHGYTMPTAEAIEFCEEIRKAKKLSSMPGIEELSKPRREVLPYGALVLERLLEALAPSAVDFSVFGIREGLVYSLLSEAERKQGPAAVLLRRVRAPALALRRACPGAVHLDGRPVRRAGAEGDGRGAPPAPCRLPALRHQLARASRLPRRAEPDPDRPVRARRHRPSRPRVPGADRLLPPHGQSAGTPRTRARTTCSERLKAIVSKKLYRRARIIGAAIRAAHMLSIGRPGIIDETPLAYERNKLVLTLPKAYAALDGERLRRRFAALAEPARARARDPRQIVSR